MTDQLDQPTATDDSTSENPETPATSPAAPDQGIEAVLERLLKSNLDQRFAGFQSLLDRKVGSLERQIGQIQRQSLSQEEVEALDETVGNQEIERLRMENQLYQLRAEHPEAVDLIMGAMGTSTLEEQIAFVESKLGQKVVAQVEAAVEAAVEQTPATSTEADPNNPGTKPKLGPAAAAFGGVDSIEAADAILDQASRGSLARGRR